MKDMNKLHFSTLINAPKKKVWSIMLDDKTYRDWTSAFIEGSHYEGSWEEGSKILFLDPDQNGMVSRIAENKPYEFISIEHIGIISNGIKDTESEEAKKWAPAYENYSFTEKDGMTELAVEMDAAEEYQKMFEETWPKALRKLKELCDK